MGAITSIPLCSRAKEEGAEKPGLPEAPSAATAVVNQPVPANVSLEIAEKLNQAKEEVEEVEDQSEEVEAVSDGEGVGLDHDSNQSIHLSGENIALDDDCDEETEGEEEKKPEEEMREQVLVGGGKRESDTAAKITDLLSELASQCESREVIQSR